MAMSHFLRCAFVLATTFNLCIGCAPSDPVVSGCETYCEGVYLCGEGTGSCEWFRSEAEIRAQCMDTCMDVAGTITEAEADDAIRCLRCLETRVSPESCTDTLVPAVQACVAECDTEIAATFNRSFAEAFPTAEYLSCP